MKYPPTPPTILFLLMLLSLIGNATGAFADEAADSLLEQDIPIFYGEEYFRERLQEPLSGRDEPIGLLLSGGSARAFAHIGVLKALDERGLSPDFIVTNSMGSIVGLLYAAGMAPDDILFFIMQSKISSLFEPEIPMRGGFLNSSFFTGLVDDLVKVDDIRDLPIPLLVVTEDLSSKRTVVLAEGDLEKVLAASFALPVYFRPVKLFGHTLIDGGISNIVPVEIPYRYTNDVIVATTFYRQELNLNNPLTILNVAMDITKARAGVEAIKEYGPLWLRCDVETYSFMDWASVEEISERGYQSTIERLDKLENRDQLVADKMERPLQVVPATYLMDIRKAKDRQFQQAFQEYIRTGVVDQGPLDWGVKAGIELDGGPNYNLLLRSRNRFTFGPYMKWNYSSAFLDSFYQPEWLNPYQMSGGGRFGGLTFGLTWMFTRRLQVEVLGDFNFSGIDFADPRQDFDSFYSYSRISIPFFWGAYTILGPFMRTEVVSNGSFSVEEILVTGGIFSRLAGGGRAGFTQNSEMALFYNKKITAVQLESSFELYPLSFLLAKQRFFSRANAVDSPGIEYFPGDYYRGSMDREAIGDFLIGNTYLGFVFPDWKPTFGETLILDYFSAGPFYDFRLSGENFEYVVGGAVEASLSIIGLSPIMLHVDYGRLDSGGGMWSFYLTM